MRFFRTALICVAAVVAVAARAEEFSWQLAGSMERSDLGISSEGDGAALGATYFFRPVDDTAGAYALAPFLSRRSRLGARYDENKTTSAVAAATVAGPLGIPLAIVPATTIVARGAGRSLAGRYVWPTSGWYVGAAIASADTAAPASPSAGSTVVGDDVTSRSIAVGKYVLRSTTVELTLDAADTELRSEFVSSCSLGMFCPVGPPTTVTTTFGAELESVGIAAMHVGRLGRLQYALSGNVTANVTEQVRETTIVPITALQPVAPALSPPAGGIAARPSFVRQRRQRYGLAGELFPTAALGIRVGYARYDGDEVLDENVELGATWFFRRKVAARIVLTRSRTALPTPTVNDVDAAALEIIGRL
jgi:hypothetical protein